MDINHLTHKVIGSAFKVHRILGPGFLEKIYENFLTLELKKLGIDVHQQIKLPVGMTDSESVCTSRISG